MDPWFTVPVMFVCVVGFIARTANSVSTAQARRQRILDETFERLGGCVQARAGEAPRTAHVRGLIDDVAVEIRYVSRSWGMNEGTWTEVAVPADGRRWTLALRERTLREQQRIGAGPAVDVALNDPAFERRLVVEGAPVRVLRAALSESLRARLANIDGLVAYTHAGEWVLAHRTWLEDSESLHTLVTLATDTHRALEAAAASGAEADLCADAARGGYRGARHIPTESGAAAASRNEVAAMNLMHARRERSARKSHAMILVAIIGYVVTVTALAMVKVS